MEHLNRLRAEYHETVRNLCYPLSLQDLYQQKERRKAIIREAQIFAETLNLQGPYWFNSEAAE